nr:hypothetical protein [Tanacetum cinerariifolium]
HTVKSIPPKFRLGFSRVLKAAIDKVICKPDNISCWVSLLVLPLCLLKTFCPRSNLGCKSDNKRQRQEESITNAIRSWGVPGCSMRLVRETLAESSSPMADVDEGDLSLSERNLKQCKRKICDGHYTAATPEVELKVFSHLIFPDPCMVVKLLSGAVSVDFDFSSELAMKRVSKTIELMDAVAKINDPQCELLLIRACTGISKLYFAMRTCPPRVFVFAQRSFDMALCSALERIVIASWLGFGDWQCRLATLPFAFGGLGVYSAGDVLNYAFLASRLQSAALQTKLFQHVGIVASGSTFDDALCVFNTSMEIDF